MKDKEIRALISLLDDDDASVVSHVEKKILSLGNQVIPLLESEWECNFNPIIQKKIEEIIHSLQFENLKTQLISWKENGGEDLLKCPFVAYFLGCESCEQFSPDLVADLLRGFRKELMARLFHLDRGLHGLGGFLT